MPKRNITIYDIAREAGVSPATVSRILTGSTSVRPEKRERVMELIEKYDYHPNAMARALTDARTKLIGLVMADTGNPYYNSVASACANEAYKRGYVPMLINTFSRPELEESALAKLRAQRADAIILCGGRIDLVEQDKAFTQLLLATTETTPVVVGSRSPAEEIPGVEVDHKRSVDLAVKYLVGLGHRKIGFVYTCMQYYGTKEKVERFCQVMKENGLEVRPEWLIDVPGYDSGSGWMGIDQLMTCEERPTALLGMNDLVTAGMLQGLLGHGLHVPEDISLMGFDDTFITAMTTPQLTAVDYDYNEYARMLLDAAEGIMRNENVPRNQMVPLSLAIKQSCRKID